MKFIPNVITFLALCSGIAAGRQALLSEWRWVVYFLIIAAVLDKADGAIAKFLKCESVFGAKFDSVSDSVNFGIVPSVVMYLWTLQDSGVVGILGCAAFTVCAFWRLINFTRVKLGLRKAVQIPGFFTGVPTPAGAFLGLLPLLLFLQFGDPAFKSPQFVAAWMVLVGALMISKVPAFALVERKSMRPYRKLVIVIATGVLILLAVEPTLTLIVMDVGYLASLPFCYRFCRRNELYR